MKFKCVFLLVCLAVVVPIHGAPTEEKNNKYTGVSNELRIDGHNSQENIFKRESHDASLNGYAQGSEAGMPSGNGINRDKRYYYPSSYYYKKHHWKKYYDYYYKKSGSKWDDKSCGDTETETTTKTKTETRTGTKTGTKTGTATGTKTGTRTGTKTTKY